MVDRVMGTFDAAAGRYEPLPALRARYPRGVGGCWMVDAVMPDAPVEEA